MRTLNFHPLFGFHKPDWFSYRLHWPQVMSEPWVLAVAVFVSLILLTGLLAIYVPTSP
jgi:hypothetical protein